MTIDQLTQKLQSRFGKSRRAGNWIRIPCPTCTLKDQKKMKRYVAIGNTGSHCFICKIPLDYMELFDGQMIGRVEDFVASSKEDKEVDPRSLELPCYHSIPVNQLPEDHPAVQFLFKDQLYELDRYSNEHGIVYVPIEGGKALQNSPFITSAERLIFPVYFQGDMVGWQMRTLPGTFYGDQPKAVKYHHIFNKGDFLYNFDNAKEFDMVVVVEGVKKALKFPNGVATFGAGVSMEQKQLIQANWKKVVVMLDAEEDNGTQKMAREMSQAFRDMGVQCVNVDLSKYHYNSPDDASAEALAKIVYDEWIRRYQL
jgi:5S rRNA maturation endonuclease (ribonuclease M5)